MNALQSTSMLSWLLSYLFNALWQIPLVFSAAWIATRMLRRVHPRASHRVWVGALFLQVVLPACDLRLDTLLSWLSSWIYRAQGGGGNVHVHVFSGSAAAAGGSTLHLQLALQTGLIVAWACCVLYFAGRLAWGLFQTSALARNATRIMPAGDTALRWKQHSQRMGITTLLPEIAASPQGIGPVTVGLRRGLLLLPPAFLEDIAPSDLDAVLAHELAHVRRRDFAKNLFYGLVSLPIAWHPVTWSTRARVAETRELICDAMAADAIAAESVTGRKQYARSLLRVASVLSARPRVATLHALGILSLNTDGRIFERRIMTLTHKPVPMNAARRILVAASCCIVALAACTTALALRADVATLTPMAGNQASGTETPAKIHVKSSVMTGQKISGDNPTYPKEARAKKIQGAVVLDAIIGKDGAIENLSVTKSPDKLLSQSALDAVRTWRYRPYLLNGEPVEVDTTINVVYNLGG
jgi:TonB family protein